MARTSDTGLPRKDREKVKGRPVWLNLLEVVDADPGVAPEPVLGAFPYKFLTRALVELQNVLVNGVLLGYLDAVLRRSYRFTEEGVR